MLELWVWNARPLITLLIVLFVVSQTLAAILSYHRHPRNRGWRSENALEFALLAQALVCSLLPGQVFYGYEASLLSPTGYAAIRIAAALTVSLFAVIVSQHTRKPWPLFALAAVCLTLPFMETVSGSAFPYFFILAVLLLSARGVGVCVLRIRELKTSLSALSIKSAIDSLPTGVLFSEKDGFILLSNERMQGLMISLAGEVLRNGNRFYELLQAGEVAIGCERRELERQIVYLLPDHSAWMFTRTELRIGRKNYYQLTAADITERWLLTEQLQMQEKQIKQSSEELSEAIGGLHILSMERETQRTKMRAHDILGQRLTVLLRAVRSKQALDYDSLRFLADGLFDELKTAEATPSPREELDRLKQIFSSLGVDVEVLGELPADNARAMLFTDIAREAVTNAVKHGFAAKVVIRLNGLNDGFRMEISNDGFPASGEIKEGGGLGGMRRRLEPFGGTLQVQTSPRFTLTIELPELPVL